jgi:hypothetical protein
LLADAARARGSAIRATDGMLRRQPARRGPAGYALDHPTNLENGGHPRRSRRCRICYANSLNRSRRPCRHGATPRHRPADPDRRRHLVRNGGPARLPLVGSPGPPCDVLRYRPLEHHSIRRAVPQPSRPVLDDDGSDGWAMVTVGMRGVRNDAISLYFADATLAARSLRGPYGIRCGAAPTRPSTTQGHRNSNPSDAFFWP